MAKNKRRNTAATRKKQGKSSPTWVDNLHWYPLVENGNESADGNQSNNNNNENTNSQNISIICWNVLAQAYLSKQSHGGLPKQYQDLVFQPSQRRKLVVKTLEKFASEETDFICLQEVDMAEVHHYFMITSKQVNYGYAGTPTTRGGGNGGRVDACCIFYNQTKFTLVRKQVVLMDDLATLTSLQRTQQSSADADKDESSLSSSLEGVCQSFLRKNTGIIVELSYGPQEQQSTIVVANVHLYWHPKYEYVKLCQAHYFMEKIKEFNTHESPCLVVGDWNSQPDSSVYNYLVHGSVNAKNVAPWYHHWKSDKTTSATSLVEDALDDMTLEEKEEQPLTSELKDDKMIHSMKQQLQQEQEEQQAPSQPKYMLDFRLNRFTRWLRILGIDAALETNTEEQERTQHNNLILFQHCARENRTLLTTSKKLLLRKDCPPGSYLINPKQDRLEDVLVHLLNSHGVTLIPRNFLTKCVICNGTIQDVTCDKIKSEILQTFDAPSSVDVVYQCRNCKQGYWWCERPTSSASRVKQQATKLFQACLQGGVPIWGDLHMFDHVHIQQEQQKQKQSPVMGRRSSSLQVVEWLKDEHLSHGLNLQPAYPKLPFTNVTRDFVGTLDYIFFEGNIEQTHRLSIPTSKQELNSISTGNGHLLPSNIWPSDHLMIGAKFELPYRQHNGRRNDPTKEEQGAAMLDESSSLTKGIATAPLSVIHNKTRSNNQGEEQEQESHAASATLIHGNAISPGSIQEESNVSHHDSNVKKHTIPPVRQLPNGSSNLGARPSRSMIRDGAKQLPQNGIKVTDAKKLKDAANATFNGGSALSPESIQVEEQRLQQEEFDVSHDANVVKHTNIPPVRTMQLPNGSSNLDAKPSRSMIRDGAQQLPSNGINVMDANASQASSSRLMTRGGARLPNGMGLNVTDAKPPTTRTGLGSNLGIKVIDAKPKSNNSSIPQRPTTRPTRRGVIGLPNGTTHCPTRCRQACCVPAGIPSMFEMAELRKQARLRKQQEQNLDS